MLNNSLSLTHFQTQTSPKRLVSNPAKTSKLSVYYYNDTHGNSDQLAGLLESAKLFKQKYQLDKDTVSFVLSAGDNVSGGNNDKNNYIYDLMQNIAQVDASAIGNHEMDPTYKGFYETAKDKKIKFIASNVEFDDDNPMKDIVKKSMILEQKGEKYGFVGAMPQDFKLCTKEEAQEGLEIEDFEGTIESLQEEIDNLKAQNINKIIMLSHSGYEMDVKLAQHLDGVDVIIGGHTHSVVDGAQHHENIVMSKSNEPVIITQAGENGKYYGILEAEFDNKGVIKKIGNKLFENTNAQKSPFLEAIKQQMLGVSPIVGKITKVDPMPQNRRTQPCAWTDLIADGIKAQMKTDIAIVNAANTRKIPQEGILTRRDVEESSPMKNKLLTTKITQKQLVDAVKQAAKESMGNQDGVPGLLHFSGVKYKIDKQGNLLELSFIDKKGKIIPIDIDNPSEKITYTASYDDFVARADGEYPILAPKFKVKKFEFDKDETLCKYISSMKNKNNLIITDDKRIEIV